MPKNLVGLWALMLIAALTSCDGKAETDNPDDDRGSAGTGERSADAPGSASGAAGDGAALAGAFCTQPLDDCSSFAPRADASYRTLSEGIAAMCEPCGPGVACMLLTGIVHGATYTYLDLDNVDVDTRLAYDSSGQLVAVLHHGLIPPYWRCLTGPPDFDPTEAIAEPILATLGNLRDTCGAGGAGGAPP